MPLQENPRVRRNDPCPCGSGKKYKKCHGASVPPEGDAIGVVVDNPKAPKNKNGSAIATPDPEADSF